MPTEWAQKTVTLQGKPRGCHVITKELYKLVPEINEFDIGMANIWRAFSLLFLLGNSALATTALSVLYFTAIRSECRLLDGGHAVMHTSASLTINENASPDVPLDLADSLDRLVPEGTKLKYRHDDEGPDDMPAHVKSSLMGPSLTVPISRGRLALGTWQG